MSKLAHYCTHFDERLWRLFHSLEKHSQLYTEEPRVCLKKVNMSNLTFFGIWKCPQIMKRMSKYYLVIYLCLLSMTGRVHALLVPRVFFDVLLWTFSEISRVNAQSRHVSRCPHTQDMPPGVWGQVTQGWAVKLAQAGRWRADGEVLIRLLGILMVGTHNKHNGFYCLEVVPQRHHPGQPLPFILFPTIPSLAESGSRRLSSSEFSIASLVTTDICLSKVCSVVYYFFLFV